MREECVINIRDTWIQEVEGHQFRYPVPEGAKDFYFQGFCRCNDSSMDFMGWTGADGTERPCGADGLYGDSDFV